MPARLTRPKVGLMPTVPHRLAGMRIEPPVSDPIATGTRRAATAAPEPPLEPPGTRVRSQGFFVGGVTLPQANSCILVLPTMIAPAARSLATTAESRRGKSMPRAVVPARVGMSAVR